MRKIEAVKCKPGMVVKDWDGNPTTIKAVGEPFDGPVGPHGEMRRGKWGAVVTFEYDDGFKENVPMFDQMYIYEPGE